MPLEDSQIALIIMFIGFTMATFESTIKQWIPSLNIELISGLLLLTAAIYLLVAVVEER